MHPPAGTGGSGLDEPKVSFTLVLGGGGIPGVAYLAGVLRALADVGELDPASADLVIGTSAGALVGALIRNGCPLEDVAERAIGVMEAGHSVPFLDAAWTTRGDLVRRWVGTSWVVGRVMIPLASPEPPRLLRQMFPGSLAVAHDRRPIESVGERWPTAPTWLVCFDVVKRRRVVLGRYPEDRAVPFSAAVQASTAVPGVFAPVRLRGQTLVDGGIRSTTNLDLAAVASPARVLCVAPLGSDPTAAIPVSKRAARLPVDLRLRRETARLTAANKEVLMLRPGARELELFPTNILRRRGARELQERAYQQAAAALRGGLSWSRQSDDGGI